MKRTVAVSLLMAAAVIPPAAPHLLRTQQPATAAGDPALGGFLKEGGDYYTEAFSGENVGDPVRGTGECTAWRRTLNCNPSGPRDPTKDKVCTDVVSSDESGFCECGGFAQFATVDCNHRPFTCETMCLKYAVITGKPAMVRTNSQNLGAKVAMDPLQAQQYLAQTMYGQQDMKVMERMGHDVEEYMDGALKSAKSNANMATDSMEKFLGKLHSAGAQDAAAAAKHKSSAEYLENKRWMEEAKRSPSTAMQGTGEDLIKIGKALQAEVNEAIPFGTGDPSQ